MLALFLILAVELAQSPGEPSVVLQYRSPDGQVIRSDVRQCPNVRLHQAADPSATATALEPDLTYRADGSVRGYLLLERSIEGCARPISFSISPDGGEVTPTPRPETSTARPRATARPDAL